MLKALAKRPVDRYATAAELAEDLARFLNHEPVKARRISPVGRLWRVARRHPGIASVSRPPPRPLSWPPPHSPTSGSSPAAEAIQRRPTRDRGSSAEIQAERQAKDAQLTAQLLVNRPRQRPRTGGQTAAAKAGADPRGRGAGDTQRGAADFRDEAVKFLVQRDVETGPN